MTTAAYARQLKALFPKGPLWNFEPDSVLSKTIDGIATELARVDERGDNIADEWDPRTTLELLTDWERVLGLPDGCTDDSSSIALRRAAIIGRLVALGGQTPQYFIDLAAAMGYTITVTEFRPYTVRSPVNTPLYGDAWAYAWQVNAALNTVRRMTVRDGVNQPLASWGNDVLECAFTRLKPAHSHVLFSYT